MERDEGREQELGTEYGMNGKSVLNDLGGLRITTGAPPDLMHDTLKSITNVVTDSDIGSYSKADEYLEIFATVYRDDISTNALRTL